MADPSSVGTGKGRLNQPDVRFWEAPGAQRDSSNTCASKTLSGRRGEVPQDGTLPTRASRASWTRRKGLKDRINTLFGKAWRGVRWVFSVLWEWLKTIRAKHDQRVRAARERHGRWHETAWLKDASDQPISTQQVDEFMRDFEAYLDDRMRGMTRVKVVPVLHRLEES